MLETTDQQLENMREKSTRPIFIIQHSFSGVTEYVSCSGDVLFDGYFYQAGGAKITSLIDSKSASFSLFASSDRIDNIDLGTWREGKCCIIYIPGLPDDELGEEYVANEGIVLIDGEITQAKFDGKKYIELNVQHVNNLSKITPRHMWDAVSIHCPPSGTELVWEGDRYTLQPRITADSVSRAGPDPSQTNVTGVTGISASLARGLSQPQQTVTLTSTGEDSPIKIILGEPSVPGDIIAIGNLSGDLILAVGWGYGEVEDYTKIYISEEEVVDGGVVGTDVTFTHYYGRFNQPVDPTLAAAIAAFNSDFILRTPNGVVGCAYTVFRIPVGVLSSSPKFNAVIKGLGVYDPRSTGVNSPVYADTVVALSFNTGEAVDYAPDPLPFTLEGEASLGRTELVLGGGYLHIPYDPSMVISTNANYSILIRFTVDELGLDAWVCGSETDNIESNKGWALQLTSAGDLLAYISSNGSAWDVNFPRTIATGIAAGDSVICAFVRELPYTGFVVNGEAVEFFGNTTPIYNDGASGIVLGGKVGGGSQSQPFTGRINFFKYIPTSYDSTIAPGEMTSGLPFPEYQKYSDTSVLCGGQIAVDPVYGLGARIKGLAECAEFNEELIDGSFQRCTLALALSTPQSTTSILDLLIAEYGECFWFNQGTDIRVTPNGIASGQVAYGTDQIAANSDFSSGSDGWSVNDPAAWAALTFIDGKCHVDGSQPSEFVMYQNAIGEPLTRYACQAFADSVSAGGFAIMDLPTLKTDAGLSYIAYTTQNSGVLGLVFGVRISADAVLTLDRVDATRLYWVEESMVEGTLRIEGVSEDQSPTQVKTRYTQPDGMSPNWPTVTGTPISRVGVDDGSVPLIDTSVYLEGVTSGVEANNKSNNKLARYNNQIKYNYVTTDTGVRHRRGDIVQITRGNYGIDLVGRILNTEMVSYGRYKVSAVRYSDNQYPSEVILPEGDGVVPLGAVVLMSGATVPDGWERYSDADGHYVVGAGGTYNIGSNGGSAIFHGFTGATSESDAHDGQTTGFQTYVVDVKIPGYAAEGSFYEYHEEIDDTTHSHTYSTGPIDFDLMTRSQRLMVKTGTSSTVFPKEAQVFALPNIVAEGVQRLTANAGRLVEAMNGEVNSGSEEVSIDVTFSDETMNHQHYQRNDTPTPDRSATLWSPAQRYYTQQTDFGTHNHYSLRLNFNRNTQKMPLALFGSDGEFKMVPGMYIFWAGDINSLPTGFVLADGDNGTYDCTDCFIEIAVNGTEGEGSGDNVVNSEYRDRPRTLSRISHEHDEFYYPEEYVGRYEFAHPNLENHTHEIVTESLWLPPYYALAVLMYSPS